MRFVTASFKALPVTKADPASLELGAEDWAAESLGPLDSCFCSTDFSAALSMGCSTGFSVGFSGAGAGDALGYSSQHNNITTYLCNHDNQEILLLDVAAGNCGIVRQDFARVNQLLMRNGKVLRFLNLDFEFSNRLFRLNVNLEAFLSRLAKRVAR